MRAGPPISVRGSSLRSRLPLVHAVHRRVLQVLHRAVHAKGGQARARAHGRAQRDEHLWGGGWVNRWGGEHGWGRAWRPGSRWDGMAHAGLLMQAVCGKPSVRQTAICAPQPPPKAHRANGLQHHPPVDALAALKEADRDGRKHAGVGGGDGDTAGGGEGWEGGGNGEAIAERGDGQATAAAMPCKWLRAIRAPTPPRPAPPRRAPALTRSEPPG